MLNDNVYKEMKCVIHTGENKVKVLRNFQEKRAELVAKQLRQCPLSLLKEMNLEQLPKAS